MGRNGPIFARMYNEFRNFNKIMYFELKCNNFFLLIKNTIYKNVIELVIISIWKEKIGRYRGQF